MSLVGTGFGYDPQLANARRRCWPRCCRRFATSGGSGRRRSTCAWSPRANWTAYFEDNLNVWDWAAGALIAAEAGARLRLPPASGSVGGTGMVVAAAPGIADAFTDALRRAGAL